MIFYHGTTDLFEIEDNILKPFTRDTFSSCIKACYAEVDGKDEAGNDIKVKVQATDNGETITFRDETYYITAGDGEPIEGKYVVTTETVDGEIVTLTKTTMENGDTFVSEADTTILHFEF